MVVLMCRDFFVILIGRRVDFGFIVVSMSSGAGRLFSSFGGVDFLLVFDC